MKPLNKNSQICFLQHTAEHIKRGEGGVGEVLLTFRVKGLSLTKTRVLLPVSKQELDLKALLIEF